MSVIPLQLEFLGGLDVVFQSQRIHKVKLPVTEEPMKLKHLIEFISTTMISNPKDVEVFLENGTIRPGILTLINDSDWELEGEEEYELEAGDVISFTSTLHGG